MLGDTQVFKADPDADEIKNVSDLFDAFSHLSGHSALDMFKARKDEAGNFIITSLYDRNRSGIATSSSSGNSKLWSK